MPELRMKSSKAANKQCCSFASSIKTHSHKGAEESFVKAFNHVRDGADGEDQRFNRFECGSSSFLEDKKDVVNKGESARLACVTSKASDMGLASIRLKRDE